MKKKKCIILSLLSIVAVIALIAGFSIYWRKIAVTKINISTSTDNTFSNGLGITDIGDPFMLKISDNEYYMYCTSSGDGFYCWKSTDMVNWEKLELCYSKDNENAWGINSFWAPEVVSYENKYYMFYTARDNSGTLKIGLAISDSPAGPFIDYENKPFLNPRFAVIDANVLIDDDGSKYLYFVRDCSTNIVDAFNTSQIYGVKLSDDMLSIDGTPALLTTPEQDWETKSGSYRWNEGPEIIKHNDTYYLSYSANYYASSDYSLGYATSDSPLGPFTKPENNPILTSVGLPDVSGPGHHSFVISPDDTELWIAYHSHTDVKNPSGDRMVNIARAGFTDNGELYINGPLTSIQPIPSNANCKNITSAFSIELITPEYSKLTDGQILVHSIGKYATEYELAKSLKLNKDDSGKCTVSFTSLNDEGTIVKQLAIFSGVDTSLEDSIGAKATSNSLTAIASVKIIANNGKIATDEFILPEDITSPLILSIDETQVNNFSIIFTPKEGIEEISLSEIDIY